MSIGDPLEAPGLSCFVSRYLVTVTHDHAEHQPGIAGADLFKERAQVFFTCVFHHRERCSIIALKASTHLDQHDGIRSFTILTCPLGFFVHHSERTGVPSSPSHEGPTSQLVPRVACTRHAMFERYPVTSRPYDRIPNFESRTH